MYRSNSIDEIIYNNYNFMFSTYNKIEPNGRPANDEMTTIKIKITDNNTNKTYVSTIDKCCTVSSKTYRSSEYLHSNSLCYALMQCQKNNTVDIKEQNNKLYLNFMRTDVDLCYHMELPLCQLNTNIENISNRLQILENKTPSDECVHIGKYNIITSNGTTDKSIYVPIKTKKIYYTYSDSNTDPKLILEYDTDSPVLNNYYSVHFALNDINFENTHLIPLKYLNINGRLVDLNSLTNNNTITHLVFSNINLGSMNLKILDSMTALRFIEIQKCTSVVDIVSFARDLYINLTIDGIVEKYDDVAFGDPNNVKKKIDEFIQNNADFCKNIILDGTNNDLNKMKLLDDQYNTIHRQYVNKFHMNKAIMEKNKNNVEKMYAPISVAKEQIANTLAEKMNLLKNKTPLGITNVAPASENKKSNTPSKFQMELGTGVYILECEQDKYYIGSSDKVFERIQAHFDGNGSEWTKKYPPLNLIEIQQQNDVHHENNITLEYMSEYGIDNVRGGAWCEIVIQKDTRKQIDQQLASINDECYRCGSNEHYSQDCDQSE